MAKAYKSLAQNPQPCMKALDIQQLMPIEVSTFSIRTFHNFVGMLGRFTLSIHGGDDGAGWKIKAINDYPIFLSKLDKIFDRLKNVTHVDLKPV